MQQTLRRESQGTPVRNVRYAFVSFYSKTHTHTAHTHTVHASVQEHSLLFIRPIDIDYQNSYYPLRRIGDSSVLHTFEHGRPGTLRFSTLHQHRGLFSFPRHHRKSAPSCRFSDICRGVTWQSRYQCRRGERERDREEMIKQIRLDRKVGAETSRRRSSRREI